MIHFNTKNLLFLLISLIFFDCNTQKEEREEVKEAELASISVEVYNPLDTTRQNVFVHISMNDLPSSDGGNYFIVLDGEKEIPSQLNRIGQFNGLVFVLDSLAANESRILKISTTANQPEYTKRTQAELSVKTGGQFQNRKYIGGEFKNIDSLRVPDEHTDHSFYIRYEGPGWESDKVGYRFYLDWRNATDVFGKTTNNMALQETGLDGFDSYHEMQDWGMDILKVGSSLGIGSPAFFNQGNAIRIDSTDSVISKVLINGDVYSSIQTNYYGWAVANQKLDIQSTYSIHAGSRITHHRMDITGDPENIATGIGKSEHAEYFHSKGNNNEYGYLATYGEQSLNEDKLGLAVLFSSGKILEITEDKHSHIVTLAPEDGAVEYYFLAAWELEKEGITTKKEFLEYVKAMAKDLANPVRVSVKER